MSDSAETGGVTVGIVYGGLSDGEGERHARTIADRVVLLVLGVSVTGCASTGRPLALDRSSSIDRCCSCQSRCEDTLPGVDELGDVMIDWIGS